MKAKISSLMSSDPITCAPSTNLAEAAALMLRGDCGILPVVEAGKIVGVVTDRDLFIAIGTRDRQPSSIRVGDVMHGPLFTCGPDDDVETVLDIMKEHAVRRVPVEGFGGTVIGIVSMNDIVRAVDQKAVRGAAVVDTMQSICAHHHPAPRIAAA
jgi:CBS domain-containing protein